MYHYITLGDIKIYMTGVGILLFILVFLFATRYYARQYRLDFTAFSLRFPWYLLFLYLGSQYTRYLIEEHVFFPTNMNQLLSYLSPYEYSFHFVGIVLGIVAIRRYIKKYQEADTRKQHLRLETFFHAICLACIPLGIFLLLGDNFIGKTTTTSLYVSAIRSDSAMAVYGKVIPLGSFLALLGLVGHVLHTFIRKKFPNHHTSIYLLYGLFCIGLFIILLFQQYPRHLVSNVGGMIVDIKHYILFIMILIFFWKRRRSISLTSSHRTTLDET